MTSPACCIALVGVCARALVRACVHICSADCIVAITTLPPPIRTAPQQTSYWFCKLTQFDYFQAGPFMRTGYRIIFGWALAMHLMHGTDFRRRCRNIDHAREKRMATGLGLERRSNFCHTHTVWFYVFFFSCRVIAYLFAHDDVNAQRERKTIEHFYLARREPSHWPAKYVNPSMRPEPTTGQPRRMVDIV